MKKLRIFTFLMLGIVSTLIPAKAQYYQMANQLGQLIAPALSGSFHYKGFVDASYLYGVGSRQASYVEVITTQGMRYSDCFFMGVGAGVQAIISDPKSTFNDWDNVYDGFDRFHGRTKTGWVIPLFTDFRFTLGDQISIGMFIDLRLGCSFLLSNDYLEIGNGYMTNSECFYLRPSFGMRIPVNINNPKQALNIGVTYQLITSNYWYYHSSKSTLSAFGVTFGFEW